MSIMKRIYKILSLLLISAALIGYTACENDIVEEEFQPQLIDFSYHSASIHYVIGEEISFLNKSVVGSSWQWNFGDGATSTEQNPVHKYNEPGTYVVKLVVDGGTYQTEKNIMISDIIPIVTYTSESPVIVYNETEVSFNVEVANPENVTVTYQWTFPKGTTGDGIDENGKSGIKSPTAVFGTIGSQNVSLKILLGTKELTPITVNVKVNYNKPVKTLYYAVKGGNLMSRKIIEEVDPEINKPFDLGYKSGKHPMTIKVAGNWVYVFDAGTRITYANDPTGLGDGELFAVATDGSKRESMIENFGGDTYFDFYYGFIDQEANMVYWTDRREGIFRTSLDTRNQKFSLDVYKHFVQNDWLGYYGKGIYWGNINGPITRIGNTFWWGKNSTGAGVFRFTEADIKGQPVTEDDPVPAAGSILTTFTIRGMAIDQVNGRIYVASQSHKMIFCFDMNGTFLKLIDPIGADDGEGGESEDIFITGMDVDVDESGNGYLYYAYRGPEGSEDPKLQSGIKRYKLNDPSAVPEYYIKGVRAYGLAIDQQAK
jgi:PKD repeat protein